MEGDGRHYDSFERHFNNTADDYDNNNRESYLSLLLRTSPPPPNDEMNISNSASGPGLHDLNNAPLESSNNMNSFGMKDVPIVNPTQSTHFFQGMQFANPTTVEYNDCERNRLFPILESQDYSLGFGQSPTPAQTQQGGGNNSPRVEEIMFGGRMIRATPVELIPAAHISGTARGVAEAPFSGPPNVQGLPPLTFREALNFPPVQFVGDEMPPVFQQPILPTFDQIVPQPTLMRPQLYNLDYELGNEMHVDPQFTSLDFGSPLNNNALQQMDEDPQFTSLSLGMPGINAMQQQTFVQPPSDDEFQEDEDEDMEEDEEDDEEDEDEEEDLLYIDASIDIAVDADALHAMELQLENLHHPGLVALEEAVVEIINPTGLQEQIIRLLLRRETYPAMANGLAPDNADASSCCICQDEYQGGQELGGLNCHHRFHFDCILEWLKRNNSCPLCRQPAIIDLTNE